MLNEEGRPGNSGPVFSREKAQDAQTENSILRRLRLFAAQPEAKPGQ
jgi:hypothetical protein